MLAKIHRQSHDVSEDQATPSRVAMQLAQVRQLQKVRKVVAAIALSVARSVILECERRVEAARAALTANEAHVAAERGKQVSQLRQVPRSAAQLGRWRRSELLLLGELQQHRENLAAASRDHREAIEEVKRRSRHLCQLEVREEKYSAMFEALDSVDVA